MEPLVFFGCFFLLGGFVVDVISTASKEWVTNRDGATSGLWTVCQTNGQCATLGREEALDGVRAMMVLSVVISGLNLLFVLLNSIWINGTNKSWILIAIAVLTVLSALLTLAGVLATLDITWKIDNYRYEYAYWMAVASVIIFFIAGVFFIASIFQSRHKRNQLQKQAKTNTSRKEYPFIIPFYDYDKEGTANETSKQDVNSGNSRKDRGTAPFQYNYRYYSTIPSPHSVRSNEYTGLINPLFQDRQNNNYLNVRELVDGHISDGNNMAVERYQGNNNLIRSRLAESARNYENFQSGGSPINTRSAYARSYTSSRVPRDVLGYPVNYHRELV